MYTLSSYDLKLHCTATGSVEQQGSVTEFRSEQTENRTATGSVEQQVNPGSAIEFRNEQTENRTATGSVEQQVYSGSAIEFRSEQTENCTATGSVEQQFNPWSAMSSVVSRQRIIQPLDLWRNKSTLGRQLSSLKFPPLQNELNETPGAILSCQAGTKSLTQAIHSESERLQQTR